MEKEEKQWINSVFNSLEGSQRAKPNSDLFQEIETRTSATPIKIIPMYQLRVASIAIILILALNVMAINNLTQQETANKSENTSFSTELISDYQY